MKRALIVLAIASDASADTDQKQQEDFAWQFAQAMDVRVYDMAVKKCAATSSKTARRGLLFETFRVIDEVQVYRFVEFDPPEEGEPVQATNEVGWLDNNKYYCMPKAEFDELVKDNLVVKHYNTFSPELMYGLKLSVPFKLRRAMDGHPTRLHKDVSLDSVIGLRFRVSSSSNYHIVAPALSLGLSTVQIDQGTTGDPDMETTTATGVTGTLGIIFEADSFQVGIMIGWDRVPGEEGKDWVYNSRPWYSMAIGYSFISSSKD